MAAWKFTDDYLSSYPALENSILSILVFSEHSISGTDFTGTMDVGASGLALTTLANLVDLQSIQVSGTVSQANDTLTVQFQSTDAAAFLNGIQTYIPLIGNQVTAASCAVKTVCLKSQTSEDEPNTDEFDLNINITIGGNSVQITSTVPMNGGFFSLTGTFEGLGIQLSDLNFLMGSLSSGEAWFPAQELGPYNQNNPSYGLLSLAITGMVTPDTFGIAISSVTVMVGISGLPLYGNKLYLDPLGVWITISDPGSNPTPTWGLSGAAKLLNYNNQGPAGLSNPDFVFEFDMAFPTPSQNSFSFSGNFDNREAQKPVTLMLKDLISPSTDVGISPTLTIDCFDIETVADTNTGTISEFQTSIAMSGGFGLLESFDLEKISISVAYSGD